jgi:hypothetical protein
MGFLALCYAGGCVFLDAIVEPSLHFLGRVEAYHGKTDQLVKELRQDLCGKIKHSRHSTILNEPAILPGDRQIIGPAPS